MCKVFNSHFYIEDLVSSVSGTNHASVIDIMKKTVGKR